ncbi:hypothetical protein JCM24511_09230 [Saitozyma sp. JCM 24511]|nr:hypothetical protein JCM24511_09230 [Saitozyma sp. JCM 24511]
MSSTTVSDSQRLAANPAEELLAAHVSQLRDGEPHTHKSIFFSGSLRFTPSDGPSRFTNLSFLDAWGKEPDASEMPFRQGTSASVLLNAAFVKVLVESSGERGLVGFVIPVGRGILEECQETSLRSVITLSMISERGYCSELWTNCSITAGTPDEADDTPFTGGNGTLHLPEDIASAVGTDSIPLCWERRFLLVLPDSLSEEMPQPSLPLVVTFLERPQRNSDGSMGAPATISLCHE